MKIRFSTDRVAQLQTVRGHQFYTIEIPKNCTLYIQYYLHRGSKRRMEHINAGSDGKVVKLSLPLVEFAGVDVRLLLINQGMFCCNCRFDIQMPYSGIYVPSTVSARVNFHIADADMAANHINFSRDRADSYDMYITEMFTDIVRENYTSGCSKEMLDSCIATALEKSDSGIRAYITAISCGVDSALLNEEMMKNNETARMIALKNAEAIGEALKRSTDEEIIGMLLGYLSATNMRPAANSSLPYQSGRKLLE